MGAAGYSMTQLRVFVRPNWTDMYVLCEAHGDAPIGVQGWHHKVFPPEVPVADVLAKHLGDVLLWPLDAPPEV